MNLSDSVEMVKGVGEATAKLLHRLGVRKVEDLLLNVPRRYEDYSLVTPIGRLRPGPVTIEAELVDIKGRYVRRGMHITEASVRDASEGMRIVWFNQPYRATGMKVGQTYFFSGTFEYKSGRLQLTNPSSEQVKDFPLNTARIIPVYKETKGLTSRQIRTFVGNCLPALRAMPESLPSWILPLYKLTPRAEAIETMHFPESMEQLEIAKQRLGFDEVLELSLASLLNKQEVASEHALRVPFEEELARQFVQSLPFALTNDQRKVVWRIYQDMQSEHPMNRLVEGDVGSGKTVVAAMAGLMAMQSGLQVALMAPTEILARQHYRSIRELLKPLGLEEQVALLVGAQTKKEREVAQGAITKGAVKFVVGTHALIQEAVDMRQLGLIIIDEQHRFGVEQRKALMQKAGHMPHVLLLTATPIPRSLALTLFGELDISVLAEKPAGRKVIETDIVSPNSRQTMYETVRSQLVTGRQVYVVCPRIQEGAEDGKKAYVSAEKMHAQVTKEFQGYTVGLLHGKMKADERDAVMSDFVAGNVQVLVATTVIEVGVDVPNATIMIIESADAFGLSQLHQLRGRVGRGEHASRCYLVLSDSKPPSRRLRAIASTNDGFRLAELDLELRGPGALYGHMQHGELDLRVAKLTDAKLIANARQAAETFLERGEDLVQYPELNERVARLRAVTNLN